MLEPSVTTNQDGTYIFLESVLCSSCVNAVCCPFNQYTSTIFKIKLHTAVELPALACFLLSKTLHTDHFCVWVCLFPLGWAYKSQATQLKRRDSLTKEDVMIRICCEKEAARYLLSKRGLTYRYFNNTYRTGPRESTFVFVSLLSGVEATTQTPPSESLTAVERPPMGNKPNSLENGL